MTAATPPERAFTSHCPDCNHLLGVTGKLHCKDNPACDWLHCTCGAVINQAGTSARSAGAWARAGTTPVGCR
jgi:hypothetical protein